MNIMIFAMLIITIFVLVFLLYMLLKRKDYPTTAGKYDVFEISENKLTVLAGIPVAYDIDGIDTITFSTVKARGGVSYTGIMCIIKENGNKSRPFLFDSSVIKNKLTLSSTREDIEKTIQYLIDELKPHGISCAPLEKEHEPY